MRILLLEDNTTDADLTKRGLSDYFIDCIIDHAFNLNQARDLLKGKSAFDIALIDVNLPDGNGLEFLVEIRERNINFPVIILTGSGDEEAAVTALKSGADDYMVKRSGYFSKLGDTINLSIINFKEKAQFKSEVINVLLIEHNSADIDLTFRHLAHYAPYIIPESVPTAEEAIAKLEKDISGEDKYSVVVMDYRLPGMNALDLIKEIRQNLKLSIPIILVTGQGSEELAVQALKLGASDYLTKGDKYLYRLPSVIVNSYQHSQLKSKQEALSESESKYRLLAENSGDVIFVLDMELKYSYISPAVKQLRGFEPEEAINQKINDVLTPESYEKAISFWNEIIHDCLKSPGKDPVRRTIELEMIRKDRSTVWTEVKATLLTDTDNNPVGILGVSRDISEKKNMIDEIILAKERAEESDKLKTSFLHNISHEIRTPLNAIVGFSALLSDPLLSSDKHEEFNDIIVKSSDQLLNIISDIINISTIEAGQAKLNLGSSNINEKCRQIYNQFTPVADNKKLTFTCSQGLEDGNAVILFDEIKIVQVLSNLVNNAFKFTRSGYVKFGYELKDDLIEFYVEDTGIGIDPENQENIFKRFMQVETDSSLHYGGSGLGLAISKAYVELHGGKIWVNSEKGVGSNFYFTIPFGKENITKPVEVEEVVDLTGTNGITKLILVAEDEELNYLLIKEYLSGNDYSIIRASNGAEAVEISRSNPKPDLVLMDLKMPVMDGYEATRLIRGFFPDLPIIAQTAYSTEADRKRALECGCNGFLSKPFGKKILISKIVEHLNIR